MKPMVFPEKRSGISGWRNGRNFRLSHYWSKYFKQDSSLLAFCKTQVCLLSARNKFACFLQEIVCEFFKNEIIEERLSAVVFLAGSLFFFFFFFFLLPSPFLICPFSRLSHLSFLICPFSRLSHFVAQISANVNIYRIDSSFLHIICAFLA